MILATSIVVAILLTLLGYVSFKYLSLKRGLSLMATASAGDSQVITSQDVPARLRKLFQMEYGAKRETDSEIAVCFRYAKFHQIGQHDQYPVDCKILMHREAYLADSTIGTELRVLIGALEKIGLQFVSVYGEKAACTTREFDSYLRTGGAEHGSWKPSKELADQYSTRLGRDNKGRFASAKAGA
jgi:hypothetical protein